MRQPERQLELLVLRLERQLEQLELLLERRPVRLVLLLRQLACQLAFQRLVRNQLIRVKSLRVKVPVQTSS